ncbi:unnamed protein product [Rotaria sordida]|uniref:Glutathione S-transferase n=1 Tax=Rotaria sordida TaxID=392033 RepID=A0A814LDB0_9BILA|nr:unnamed protein product [Rotaria sordida]CAF1250187.1 unnamed protein product [Rotaria sordida]
MLEDIAAKYPNVEYQEDVELFEKFAEEWPARKADRSISGPFGNLPVLHWNNTHIIAQTLPIGQFIARKFDLYGKPKPTNEDPIVFQALIDGVVSCAYTDIIFNIFMVLWNQVDFDDSTDPYARLVKKIAGDLKMLNDLLAKSSTSFFYDQDEPTIADYFVFYAFTLAKDVHSALLPANEDSQALDKLEQVMRNRPALAKYFNEGRLYNRFSGSPTEEQYRAKLVAKKN